MIRRAAGFTLAELLVVIAVLSVVSTLGMTAFSAVTGHYRTQSVRMDLATRAERGFAQVQDDVGRVLPTGRGAPAIRGERRMEETLRYGRVPLEDDALTLPIESVHPETGLAEHLSVRYAIDRGGPVPVLRRTLGPLGADPPAGASIEVLRGVLSMTVEFHDGTGWRRGWDGPRHPRAVRVAIVAQDPDRPFEQVARRAEFTVHVP